MRPRCLMRGYVAFRISRVQSRARTACSVGIPPGQPTRSSQDSGVAQFLDELELMAQQEFHGLEHPAVVFRETGSSLRLISCRRRAG